MATGQFFKLGASLILIFFVLACGANDTEKVDKKLKNGKDVESFEKKDLSAVNSVSQSVESRNKRFGMLYFLWHCPASKNPINIFETLKREGVFGVLEGTRFLERNPDKFGPIGAFHYWDKPEQGYYCLSEREDILARHARQLRDSGIDFVVLDVSNHPNTSELNFEAMIGKPFEQMVKVWKKIPRAPKIVPWVPFQPYGSSGGATNQSATLSLDYMSRFLKSQAPNLLFQVNGKSMIGLVNDRDRFSDDSIIDKNIARYSKEWKIFKMWGLRDIRNTDNWSFLSPCQNPDEYRNRNGFRICNQTSSREMVSVTAAFQGSRVERGGAPKFHGRTLVNQFREVYTNIEAPFVLITGWNEWIAQRLELPDANGKSEFIDLFDFERNRDIEPGGITGDYYLYLLRNLIQDYRNGLEFSINNYYLTRDSLFNHGYYANRYKSVVKEVGNSRAALKKHWLKVGIARGFSPSPAFIPSQYKKRNQDLQSFTPTQLLSHFIADGFYEGRIGSEKFHAKTYLANHADLRNAFGSNFYFAALKHWEIFGYRESGRDPIPK